MQTFGVFAFCITFVTGFDLKTDGIQDILVQIRAGTPCTDIIAQYLAQIDESNEKWNAIIAKNPNASIEAKALDDQYHGTNNIKGMIELLFSDHLRVCHYKEVLNS